MDVLKINSLNGDTAIFEKKKKSGLSRKTPIETLYIFLFYFFFALHESHGQQQEIVGG